MNKRILLSIFLVIVWGIVIFTFSGMSGDESNSKSYEIVDNIIEIFDKITNASSETVKKHQTDLFREKANYLFRKTCHAFVYFTLAILIFNLLITILQKKLLIYNLFTLLFCTLYSIFDEFHQTLVMGRTGQFRDVLIDTSGAIIGCLFISSIYKIAKKCQKTKKIKKISLDTCNK